MTQKIRFIISVIATLQELSKILRKVRDLVKLYTDLGYGTTDPIEAEDFNVSRPGEFDLTGITVEAFNAAAAVLVEFQSFMGGGTSTAKDREAVISKIRKDF